MTHPIDIPDGIYAKVAASGLGHIGEHVAIARKAANDRAGSVWLVFNGSSARVDPGDSDGDIYRKWEAQRDRYHLDAGIK